MSHRLPPFSLGVDAHGVPWSLNLSTGALEPAIEGSPAERPPSLPVLPRKAVTLDTVAAALRHAGLRVQRGDSGEVEVATTIGPLRLRISNAGDLLHLVRFFDFQDSVPKRYRFVLANQLNCLVDTGSFLLCDPESMTASLTWVVGPGIAPAALREAIVRFADSAGEAMEEAKAHALLA
jgi:hypothetical protein